MKEEWKEIEGYEGLYEISNKGKVKSVSRQVNVIRKGKTFERHYSEMIMCAENKRGHLYIILTKNKANKRFKINNLVANAFVDGKGEYIRHIDGNTLNNSSNNLEWTSEKQEIVSDTSKELRTDMDYMQTFISTEINAMRAEKTVRKNHEIYCFKKEQAELLESEIPLIFKGWIAQWDYSLIDKCYKVVCKRV